MRSAKTLLITGLLSVIVIFGVSTLVTRSHEYQWDFQTYYYAAQAHARGLDPYSPADLAQLSGSEFRLSFVYPPLTLWFFRIWTVMPYQVAYQVWLFFKLLLLAGLVVLWRQNLFKDASGYIVALVVLFAFSLTVYVDLATGNISIVEQFPLWLGIVFLLRGRPGLFCLGVVLASLFKITLAAFLLLLLLTRSKRKWLYLGGSLAGLIAVHATGYGLAPDLYQRFVDSAMAIEEGGRYGNPSLYALIRDLADMSSGPNAVGDAGVFATVVYLAAVAAVLVPTVRRLRQFAHAPSRSTLVLGVYLFSLTYALTVPRMKTYSFILLIPVAVYLVQHSAKLAAAGFLLALLVLTTHPPMPVPLPIRPLLSTFWLYYPLLLAGLLWWLFLWHTDHSISTALSPQGKTE